MLKEKIKIKKIELYKDERGLFAKIFDYMELEDKDIQDIYITHTKPGQSRGDHYHKKTTEWFCAVKGRGIMKLRDIETNEELEIEINGETISVIELPPKINHIVSCTGDEELILLAFANQPYKKDDTDTYSAQQK